jgi:hypothetical protein
MLKLARGSVIAGGLIGFAPPAGMTVDYESLVHPIFQ